MTNITLSFICKIEMQICQVMKVGGKVAEKLFERIRIEGLARERQGGWGGGRWG